MIEYKVARAGKEDMQLVHNMAEIVFRHTYREILSSEQMEYMMDWMYSLPNLRRQLDDGHIYHIAYDGERPCGYVSVQPEGIAEDGMPLYQLQKIYVLPSEQGKGLGKILFRTAVAVVRSMTPQLPARMELNVNRNNPAVGFYRHLGMDILREGDFHIGNGFYMNDYIMGLEIKADLP